MSTSLEMKNLNGNCGEASRIYRSNLTPVSFLKRAACIYSNKIAVVHGNRRYTYREFAERVNRLSSQLIREGVQPGDRIAFLSPNTPAMLEAHFAVPAAGGILVAINNRLSATEIDYILQHSGSRWLFIDASLRQLGESLNTTAIRVVYIEDTGSAGDPYEDFLSDGTPTAVEIDSENEEQIIAINYTSGTTGQPKGVMYSHRGTYLNALNQALETQMGNDSVFLHTVPMFHCNGWCFPWAVTAVGGTHICLRQCNPELIWRLLTEEGVTLHGSSPTLLIMLANHAAARRLERTVTVCIAGSPPSPALLNNLKSLNFRPKHLYGLTETYGPMASCNWQQEWIHQPAEEQSRLQARQGQAQVTADLMRVVDSEMNDVERDGCTLGEVVMRGNTVMNGYYADPDASSLAFRGGWFHSGDLAVWHPDGYIELRDRQKDIIVSGAETISTIEVEQVLVRHPSVLECAVIAIPDELWGERPKAFVTLKPGQLATELELITFCRERIAHFKCPAAVAFEDLPKTATGKIQKYVLREREWRGLEKRIN